MVKINRHVIDEMLSVLQSDNRFQVVKLRECYEIDKEVFKELLVENTYNRKDYLVVSAISKGEPPYNLRIEFNLTIEDCDLIVNNTINEMIGYITLLQDETNASINLGHLESTTLRSLRSKLQNTTYRTIAKRGLKTVGELKHYCSLSSHNRYALGTGVLLDLAYTLVTVGFEIEEMSWLFSDGVKEEGKYDITKQTETTILSNEYGDLAVLNKISDSYAIATFTKVDSSYVTSEIITDSTLINNWSRVIESWGGFKTRNNIKETPTTSDIKNKAKSIISNILDKDKDKIDCCVVGTPSENTTIFSYQDKDSGEK